MSTLADDPHNTQVQSELYAGTPLKRGIAWIFDMVLIGILSALILPFTAFTGVFFFPAMMLVVGFLYRWFTIASGSATWGMQMVGVQLRDHHGRQLQSGTALAHTFGYTISVAVAPLQLISILMMLFSERRQGLTDHLLGTTAINTSR